MKRIIISLFFAFSLFISFGFNANDINNVNKVNDINEENQYYTILLDENEDIDSFMQQVKSINAELVYKIEEIGLFQLKAKYSEIQKLTKKITISTYNPSIKLFKTSNLLESSSGFISKSSLWDIQWDMQKVTNRGESYKIFSGTKNVTVGIIDSGLDIDHSDLKNNVVSNSKNLVPRGGFRGQENYETGDINRLNDILGHGTNVAGQIAANGLIKGVAPNIGISIYRVFGGKSAESSWVIKAIVEAAKDDVDVINLSLGDYLVDGDILFEDEKTHGNIAEIRAYKRAIEYARFKGSVVVTALGNDSLNLNESTQMTDFLKERLERNDAVFKGDILDVPGTLPGTISVASIGPSDELSTFSNFGDGVIDIVSPGGDFRILQNYGSERWLNEKLFLREMIVSTHPGGKYTFTSGNSLAAPKVSGALALIIDKYNLKNKPNESSEFLYKYGVRSDIFNPNIFGKGILDVYRIVNQ
ncbi:S8 family serine peptidase [Bacillus cereus group sp. BfR-BA-01524]|uniref:S8 family peptidase n=1 Tax=Bacillus cereus group sp. BfR-BA-01524 TaxID=2920372 RepID=UPI001F5A499B